MAKPRHRRKLEEIREQIGVFIEGDADPQGRYLLAYYALGDVLKRRAITRSTITRVRNSFLLRTEPEYQSIARALTEYLARRETNGE